MQRPIIYFHINTKCILISTLISSPGFERQITRITAICEALEKQFGEESFEKSAHF
jgi:hypothetical protein